MNIGNGKFLLGDCLELMKSIPDGSIDMILCDLPYGTTACKWDTIIPFEQLWEQYWRISKPNTAIVLTSSQPFTTTLIASQIELHKYNLIWKKSKISHFAQAPYRFLTEHEDIVVFSKGGCTNNSLIKMNYFPQDLIDVKIEKPGLITNHSEHRPNRKSQKAYIQEKTGYPKSILDFKSEKGFHPTQKPVALFEYLIKTYTNENMTVLDNCAGSGTTAIAAERTNRKWICMEQEQQYYYGAISRVWDEVNK